jgi:hypothetical protein
MSTNNVMLTIGAFMLFSLMLVTFYKLLANSGDMINNTQAGVSEISYATTYMELAQGLAFDEVTQDDLKHDSTSLTPVANLGPDVAPSGEPTENCFSNFDDFDDLNGYEIIDSSQQGITGIFKTHFKVYYTKSSNLDLVSTTPTFIKRCDMWVLRLSPPSPDTMKMSLVLGYFHFD